MRVIILPEVIGYFEDLMDILFQKKYFGFQESANQYVIDLITDIKTHLHTCLHKPAPTFFDKYGKDMDYAIFNKNNHTSWYVFFTSYEVENEVIYLIRYVANNHTISQYL